MDPLGQMKIFVRVAEFQSFTKTADFLNLPKATVSTSIRNLEDQLTVRLLNRTTRQVTLTSEGEQYLERCRELLSDFDETESMFRHKPGNLKGKIRVDMSYSFADISFLPILPRFIEKYPQIEIELSCSDQTIDLVREGIDCVIRSGSISQPGTVEKVIAQAPMINCVSPDYIKKYGKPKTLEDLRSHKLIFYSQTLSGKRWGFEYFDGKTYKEVKMQGILTVNNTAAYQKSCLAGLGIIQAPLHGVFSRLQSGELVEILPKFRAEPLNIKIVFVQRRLLATRVRIFMDWLVEELKTLKK